MDAERFYVRESVGFPVIGGRTLSVELLVLDSAYCHRVVASSRTDERSSRDLLERRRRRADDLVAQLNAADRGEAVQPARERGSC